MFGNLTTVVKNLLILNVLMFIVTQILKTKGIYLENILNMYPVNSPLFQPYQVITSMFMHADIMHLVLNMFGLVMFGTILEKVWSEKRFFIFYFASGIGAMILSQAFGIYEIHQAKNELISVGIPPDVIYNQINNSSSMYSNMVSFQNYSDPVLESKVLHYVNMITGGSLGASGAIFGVLAGFGILFPNTELQMIFPPIRAKAKYFIIGYMILEIALFYAKLKDDNVNHLAHLGGAIVGAIIVLYWRKRSNNFY